MQPVFEDPYAILGLQRGADTTAIKHAYFALVRAHPPERDPDTFKRIRGAYERLRDVGQRSETDMLLPRTWRPTGSQRRAPSLDLRLHTEDVLEAARSLSDLGRTDWHEHHRTVKLDP